MAAMKRTYKPLQKQTFSIGDYSIVPIRDQDKYDIMQWRNEQIYHLRQNDILTKEKQEAYFKNVVSQLFEQAQPEQLLFSYLHNDKCIGYGGLVHINWHKKTAELSFIMATQLEKNAFEKHWLIFLNLIEKVAFNEINLNQIFTYAYDLRPHLYPVLDKAGFKQIRKLKNKIIIDNQTVDVVIHQKDKPEIVFRDARKADEKLLYDWANDDLVRQQSFNSQKIAYPEHQKWFRQKFQDSNNLFWIAEINKHPIGLVRFSLEKNHAVIGVSIDQNHRGKGYAGKMLQLASQKFLQVFNLPIHAYIKKTNTASIRSFEKAGYKFEKELIIHESDSYLYVKKTE